VAILPDVVKLVVDILDSAGISLIGTRVYGFELPATPTYPAVRILRLGGSSVVDDWLDGARIQVDVFGGTAEQAWDATAAVRSKLWDLEGLHVPGSGMVTGIQEISGPAWLPDPRTERARWTWDIRVYAHP
jgi:hypothetical protein